MKLKRITIENVLAVRAVDLELDTPITLIAGPNEAGKSSIVDAIRLAFLGDPVRVKLKKELGALVHDGADAGVVNISGDGFAAAVSLPSGKCAVQGLSSMNLNLDSSLSPSHFSSLPVTDRRGFLFDVLGVKLDAETMAAKLEARGHSNERIKSIAPFFGRVSWDDLAKTCATKATEAKGAWKAATGEQWGERKAETWLPTIPSSTTSGTVTQCALEIERVDKLIGEHQRKIGALEASAINAKGRAEKMAKLRREADGGDLYLEQRAQAQSELAHLQAQLEAVSATILPCPHCETLLQLADGPSLTLASQSDIDNREGQDAASLRKEIADMEAYIQDRTEKITQSDAAVMTLRQLKDAEAVPPSEDEIIKVREAVTQLQDERRSWETTRLKLEQHEAALRTADSKREQAQSLHKDVVGWLALSEAVGSSGIPGEVLAEALGEFNGRLSYTAGLAGWKPVKIDTDMEITIGDRAYALCSESAKWRADCLIAEAAAFWTSRFLVLDRVDVLDLKNRVALIRLMSRLAELGHVHTVILTGTFKAAPTGLPPSVRVHWIEGGVIADTTTEKAAA